MHEYYSLMENEKAAKKGGRCKGVREGGRERKKEKIKELNSTNLVIESAFYES